MEAKETKPPPRYNEGTLVEAMQNAWRFVEDPALRERLKEAKGIGTPATRAEIIKGLKRQDFLAAQGKLIVPTERGLALFGVLERADPALVDPGVTARLEFLLDEVLVGKQETEAAIDAVCDQAARIIGRLVESDAAPPLPGSGAAGATLPGIVPPPGAARPPSPAMRKYVEDLGSTAEGQAAVRLHQVGRGLPRLPRPACAEAGECRGRQRWSGTRAERGAAALRGADRAGAGHHGPGGGQGERPEPLRLDRREPEQGRQEVHQRPRPVPPGRWPVAACPAGLAPGREPLSPRRRARR